MANIESKNLLVWVKAMSRGQALPLDASEIHQTLAEAEAYAASAIAYEGQTIKAKLEDGKYHEYILQPTQGGYVLEEVGAISADDLKQYVQIVTTLPTANQEQGVVYICGDIGYIWNGSSWKPIFDCRVEYDDITALENNKANKENPAFTGTVTVTGNIQLNGEDVALKSYVEGLFAQLKESSIPDIVDSSHSIASDYKAGQSYRVAEAGTYAGVKCEVGDLILVIKDYNAETASTADFMVLQSNIDGAVTSTASAVTVGEIVVFDSVNGKVIKGAGVQIASLNEAIAKAHTHTNKDKLDTYDKTQEELLAAATEEARGLITDKADKATTLAGYGITDAYTKTEEDAYRELISQNINSKISASEVDDKIDDAKEAILEEAAQNAADALEERIGGIPSETTLKSYIDTAIGSGGTSSAAAIATAKQEAIDTSKTYTDTQITSALSVIEF